MTEYIDMLSRKQEKKRRHLNDYLFICWHNTHDIIIEVFKEIDLNCAEQAAIGFLTQYKIPLDTVKWDVKPIESTVNINITNTEGFQTVVEV
jgi:hypothetical protein